MHETIESHVIKAVIDKQTNKSKYLLSKFLKDVFNHLVSSSKISDIKLFTIVTDAIFYMLTNNKKDYISWNDYTTELQECFVDIKFPERIKKVILRLRSYHESSPLMIKHSNEKVLFKIIHKLLLLPTSQEMEIDYDQDCKDKINELTSFTNLSSNSTLDEFKEFTESFNNSLKILREIADSCSVTCTDFDQCIKGIKTSIDLIFTLVDLSSFDIITKTINDIYMKFEIKNLNSLLTLDLTAFYIGNTFMKLATGAKLNIVTETGYFENIINLYSRNYFISHLKNISNVDIYNEWVCFKTIQTYIDSEKTNEDLVIFRVDTLTLLGSENLDILTDFLANFGSLNVLQASRQLTIFYNYCGTKNITIINEQFSTYHNNYNNSIINILKDVDSFAAKYGVNTLEEASTLMTQVFNVTGVSKLQDLHSQLISLSKVYTESIDGTFSLTEIDTLIVSLKECQDNLSTVPGDTFNDKILFLSKHLLDKLNIICPNITYDSLIEFLIEISRNGQLNDISMKNILEKVNNYNKHLLEVNTLQETNISLTQELHECNEQRSEQLKKFENREKEYELLLQQNKDLEKKIYDFEINEIKYTTDLDQINNKFLELSNDNAVLEEKYNSLEVKHSKLLEDNNEIITNRRIAIGLPMKRNRTTSPDNFGKRHRGDSPEPS